MPLSELYKFYLIALDSTFRDAATYNPEKNTRSSKPSNPIGISAMMSSTRQITLSGSPTPASKGVTSARPELKLLLYLVQRRDIEVKDHNAHVDPDFLSKLSGSRKESALCKLQMLSRRQLGTELTNPQNRKGAPLPHNRPGMWQFFGERPIECLPSKMRGFPHCNSPMGKNPCILKLKP